MKRPPLQKVSSLCRTWYLAACFTFIAIYAPAQSYTIDWYKVSGGGGTSTGGVFAVSGTIGQHDAGGPMTGGDFSIIGGFWTAAATVMVPGGPTLTITRSGNSVTVSWPSSASEFHLQQNTSPANPSGWVICGSTVTSSNGVSSVTFAPAVGTLFLRLCYP